MSIQIRIEKLLAGETVCYSEPGNSMKGIIEHRQPITCASIKDYSKIEVGDAVFCKVKGYYYTHLVKAIRENKSDDGSVFEFLIGNNRGGINGWTNQNKVFGKVIKVG